MWSGPTCVGREGSGQASAGAMSPKSTAAMRRDGPQGDGPSRQAKPCQRRVSSASIRVGSFPARLAPLVTNCSGRAEVRATQLEGIDDFDFTGRGSEILAALNQASKLVRVGADGVPDDLVRRRPWFPACRPWRPAGPHDRNCWPTRRRRGSSCPMAPSSVSRWPGTAHGQSDTAADPPRPERWER